MIKKLLFVVLLTLFFSCGQSPTNNKATYWTGEGWYNPDKTEQEYTDDLYECQKEAFTAPSRFTKFTVDNKCMRDRGYVWK
jgi:hypothetical protein